MTLEFQSRLPQQTPMIKLPAVTGGEPRRPAILAHRGASHDAPENTLAAFRLAWEQGADGIEGDFWLTADRQIVCIHDATTTRTSGMRYVVAESTLDELRQLDVGRWKHTRYAGERIATLEEVLATVPAGKQCVIEIKCDAQIVPWLCDVLRTTDVPLGQLTVISYYEQVISSLHEQMPELATAMIFRYGLNSAAGVWTPTQDEVMATLQRAGASGFSTHCNRRVIDAAFVAPLREAGYRLNTWTVDDPETAAYFAGLGFDSITSNRPAALLAAFDAARSGPLVP